MITIKKKSWHYRVWESTYAYCIMNLKPFCNSAEWGLTHYKKNVHRVHKVTLCNYTWRVIAAPFFWLLFLICTSLLIVVSPILGVISFCIWVSNNRERKIVTKLAKEHELSYEKAWMEYRWGGLQPIAKKDPGFIKIAWESVKAWKEKHCPIVKIED